MANHELNLPAVLLTEGGLFACEVVLGHNANEARTILFRGEKDIGEELMERWNAGLAPNASSAPIISRMVVRNPNDEPVHICIRAAPMRMYEVFVAGGFLHDGQDTAEYPTFGAAVMRMALEAQMARE